MTDPVHQAGNIPIPGHGFVNGQRVRARLGRVFAVRNPADGQVIADVPDMDADDTESAVASCAEAFKAWSKLPAAQRASLLRAWHGRILADIDNLAALLTLEQGKPLAESRAEVEYAAGYVEWFAAEAVRTYGDVLPSPLADRRMLVLKEAVGVCAAITPWNFPAAMVTRKAAACLAAGCTMVVKPAEQTPLTALRLAELAHEAGIPAGVLNVVTGDPVRIGKVLTSHTAIRKLSFTGSTEVGRLLMRQCSDTVKRLSLELGGNAPFLVFDDADIDAAVAGAIVSKFRNAGQTCVCANRIYVQRGVYDAFAAALARAASELRVGRGDVPGVDIGPLIDAAALQKVESHIADARAHGGRVLIGGRRHELGGTFLEPTVIADANQAMRIASEETFGPVAALFPFDTEEEAIRLANDTEYGLGAYLYASGMARIVRMFESLEYGMVAVNTGMLSNVAIPFGGIKQSGFGREGAHYGIEEYLSLKYVCLAGVGRS